MYIKMIEKLLKDDYAYIANGNVYYDTSKFSKYYELSGRNKDDLLVAVRNDIEEDNSKRNPFDFGLWFTNSKFNNQELKVGFTLGCRISWLAYRVFWYFN